MGNVEKFFDPSPENMVKGSVSMATESRRPVGVTYSGRGRDEPGIRAAGFDIAARSNTIQSTARPTNSTFLSRAPICRSVVDIDGQYIRSNSD